MLSYNRLISFNFKIDHGKGLGVDGKYPQLYLWEGGGKDTFPSVGIISCTSPFNEGSSLKHFILDSEVDGGGDFIQCEIFQALPGGKRNQKLGQHRSLQIFQIKIDGQYLPSARVDGRPPTRA